MWNSALLAGLAAGDAKKRCPAAIAAAAALLGGDTGIPPEELEYVTMHAGPMQLLTVLR
jgi:hypothetical protein